MKKRAISNPVTALIHDGRLLVVCGDGTVTSYGRFAPNEDNVWHEQEPVPNSLRAVSWKKERQTYLGHWQEMVDGLSAPGDMSDAEVKAFVDNFIAKTKGAADDD